MYPKLPVFLAALALAVQSFTVFAQHGEVDITFNPYDTAQFQAIDGTNNTIFELERQPDGKILIGGEFTQYHSQPAHYFTRTLPNGEPDPAFSQVQVEPSYTIRAIELQPDNKILIGGEMYTYNGVATSIARLHPDGSQDNAFSAGIANGTIFDIKVQAGGKIVVCGSFTTWNGSPANRLVRLNSDGTVDNTFNTGTGPDDFVTGLAITPGGALLVAGYFSNFNGTTANRYIQLTADGAIDPAFTLNALNNYYREILSLPDGKILVCAWNTVSRLNADGTIDLSFTETVSPGVTLGATLLSNGKIASYGYGALVLRNADGTIDTGFSTAMMSGGEEVHAVVELPSGDLIVGGNFVFMNNVPNYNIQVLSQTGVVPPGRIGLGGVSQAIAVQPDNKVLVGGGFNTYSYEQAHDFMRLLPNGEIDTAFRANLGTGVNGEVTDICLLSNGDMLIAGGFTSVNGTPMSQVARIFADGTPDYTLTPPTFDGPVLSVAQQSDGKILVAGSFNYVNNQVRYYIARLNSDGTLDNSFFSPLYDNVVFGMGAYKIEETPDQKILVAGKFACCNPVLRLHANGAIDNSFWMNTSAYQIHDFLQLDDGKLLVGGIWSSFAGHSNWVLSRLLPNGFPDPAYNHLDGGLGYTPNSVESIIRVNDDAILVSGTFETGPPNMRACFLVSNDGIRDTLFDVQQTFRLIGNVQAVMDAGVQSDGRIIIGGRYETIGNFRRQGIARLYQSTFLSAAICDGDSFAFGGQQLTQSGSYSTTLQSAIGTDSVVVLGLNVAEVNDTVTLNGATLTADCAGCTYQWLDCATNSPVPGATNAAFTPQATGDYAVALADGTCTDTSACTHVDVLGIAAGTTIAFRLYPNPATSQVTVVLPGTEGRTLLFIADAAGRRVYETATDTAETTLRPNLSPGVYSLTVVSERFSSTQRFVVR